MTTATLQKLLKNPHRAVFETGPDQVLAFRLRHTSGATWAVLDDALTVKWLAYPSGKSYNLGQLTVEELIAALRADGLDVISTNADIYGLKALVLVAGEGDQFESNGDHVYAFTNVLWSIFGGYAVALKEADRQIGQALRQMVLHQAEDIWLDLWGQIYGISRLPSEPDAQYAARIQAEVMRPRLNKYAIENAVEASLGKRIEIREPWNLVFRTSSSKLSDSHHLQSADYYTSCIIHPIATESIDWAAALEIINRNRAAGVIVYPPVIQFSPRGVSSYPLFEYLVFDAREDLRTTGVKGGGGQPLGEMVLDGANNIMFNHPLSAYHLRVFANATGLQDAQIIGLPRSVARAAIVLSDGAPLGDQNTIFSRGDVRYTQGIDGDLSGDLALSDYAVDAVARPVELVTTNAHADSVEYTYITEIAASNMDALMTAYVSVYDGINVWSGSWGTRTWTGWRTVGSVMSSVSS